MASQISLIVRAMIYVLLFDRAFSVIDTEGVRVVSKEELANKTTEENELWLAILGEVYNVTAGARHYKENATYHVFVGRDGSAAFVTGNFTPAGAEKGLYETLKPEELTSLETWREFYANEEKYPFIGVLEGELYDKDGKPTEGMRKIEEAVAEGKKKVEERVKRNKEKAEKRRKEKEAKEAAERKAYAEKKANEQKKEAAERKAYAEKKVNEQKAADNEL